MRHAAVRALVALLLAVGAAALALRGGAPRVTALALGAGAAGFHANP